MHTVNPILLTCVKLIEGNQDPVPICTFKTNIRFCDKPILSL
jgi:hypothetical protein